MTRILPTRNGNSKPYAVRLALDTDTDPTYKEWKPFSLFPNMRGQSPTRILPTRNGNRFIRFPTKVEERKHGSYLQGMETFAPCRSIVQRRATNTDPTYKEWKLRL